MSKKYAIALRRKNNDLIGYFTLNIENEENVKIESSDSLSILNSRVYNEMDIRTFERDKTFVIFYRNKDDSNKCFIYFKVKDDTITHIDTSNKSVDAHLYYEEDFDTLKLEFELK